VNKILAVAVAICLFWACQEDTVVTSISGNVYSDCNTPIANGEVAYKVNAGGSYSDPIIIASAITNSSGYFQFTYELEEDESGTADLILIEKEGYQTFIQGLELKKDKSLSLYLENTSTITVKLSGTKSWTGTDTLFYGLNPAGYENDTMPTANGSLDPIQVQVPNLYKSASTYTFYYGVGEADFKIAKSALTDENSNYQNISLSLEGCSQNEQVEMTIN
jgi:hypothetical protein